MYQTQCEPGYFGPTCADRCPPGTFGEKCGGSCFSVCSKDLCHYLFGCLTNTTDIIQTTHAGKIQWTFNSLIYSSIIFISISYFHFFKFKVRHLQDHFLIPLVDILLLNKTLMCSPQKCLQQKLDWTHRFWLLVLGQLF